jgi:micrococcal nuclease
MTLSLYNYRCLVKRVVDGDTVQAEIDLGFHLKFTAVVQMLYYDAPEAMRQHARSEAELNEGLLAKNELVGMVLDKPGVMIRTQLDRADKYGRVMGLLWIEGEQNTVNNQMLAFTNTQWIKLGGKPDPK